MKQRDTTILFGILILVSFCMGHACVNVHAFWTELVIFWVACAIFIPFRFLPNVLMVSDVILQLQSVSRLTFVNKMKKKYACTIIFPLCLQGAFGRSSISLFNRQFCRAHDDFISKPKFCYFIISPTPLSLNRNTL